jgi:hypothetical protein
MINFVLIFFKYLKYQLYFMFTLFGKVIKTTVLTRESMNCIIHFIHLLLSYSFLSTKQVL